MAVLSSQPDRAPKLIRTEAEWRKILTPIQYRVLREQATEPPFSGIYDTEFSPGVYHCGGCGAELFFSRAKFDSGCGWPAFDEPISHEFILAQADDSLGMRRIEVRCACCGGHLGHVFDDGPTETGVRYCINSEALAFKPEIS